MARVLLSQDLSLPHQTWRSQSRLHLCSLNINIVSIDDGQDATGKAAHELGMGDHVVQSCVAAVSACRRPWRQCIACASAPSAFAPDTPAY